MKNKDENMRSKIEEVTVDTERGEGRRPEAQRLRRERGKRITREENQKMVKPGLVRK